MAQERSVRFVKYMQFHTSSVSLEDIEGLVNAELEALQAVSTVRIDTIHTRPTLDSVTGYVWHFVSITGRRITRDQPPPAAQADPSGIPPLLMVTPDLYDTGCAESS